LKIITEKYECTCLDYCEPQSPCTLRDESEKCCQDGDICKICKKVICAWIYDDEGYCQLCYSQRDYKNNFRKNWYERESWIPEIHKMLMGLYKESRSFKEPIDPELVMKIIDKLQDVMYEKHLEDGKLN